MKKLNVLVTGAGSGIGAATAQLFSEKGHHVILTGRNQDALKKVASHFKTSYSIIPADLTKPDDVKNLVKESLKAVPEISVLINNAGIYEVKSFTDSDDQFWESMLATNLLGPVRLTRELIPSLKESKGVVVNVGSTAGYRPRKSGVTYATSKAAVISLTQSLALEYVKDGIRFHCVCPAIVETPIHKLDQMNRDELAAIQKKWSAYIPMGRTGTPLEIAHAIYNFCTPEARMDDWGGFTH